MSGTSLDGLDIAYCKITGHNNFQLIAAATVPYPDEWRKRLKKLHKASAIEYAKTDSELGHWFGLQVQQFRAIHQGPVDCIASHGHTVFHQPESGFTAQIGDGNAIHAVTSVPVVCDFRRLDVALGGQGAPLVPIGDRLLFGDYGCCINLGGIANISYEQQGERKAYDISPCNMALNRLAAEKGKEYDVDGQMARSGALLPPLLQLMESLDYYRLPPPKSLGKEWFEKTFEPLLSCPAPLEDRMRTTVEHIALRLASAIPNGCPTVLLSGGGAHNSFLVERLRQMLPDKKIVIPDKDIIDYKEAIIFALLAWLRMNGEVNTLASVTGARIDSCGGTVCGVTKVGAHS